MTTHSPCGEDWIPRADLAALMRKSPDTVRRAVDKHGLDTRTDDAGRVLVRVADFLRLGHLRAEDILPGTTATESAEVLRARDTVTALTAQVAELTGRIATTDTLVSTLRDQLDRKDKQLGRQSEQLSQLTQAISRLAGSRAAA